MIRRSFRPILDKVGLPAIRFHDLRHSTATLLLSLGIHAKVVQELLGHSQISLTLGHAVVQGCLGVSSGGAVTVAVKVG